VALTAVASPGEAYDCIRAPPLVDGSTVIPPRVDSPGAIDYRQTSTEWWDHAIDPHGIAPPVCLRHRGQQAQLVRSTTVEPDRRADGRHRERPPRIECTVASLVEGSSLLGDKAMLGAGAVVDETVGQTSAENSLARVLGSPQRPSPAVGLCAR
jgi:hypothetical protein